MNKRKIYFITSLLIVLIALTLLATGSKILLIPVLTEPPFPLGNLITWAGFIALPSTILFSSESIFKPFNPSGFVIHKALKVLVVVGFGWGIIAYFLSGNWTNTFGKSDGFQGSVQASQIFWMFNYLLAVLPISMLILSAAINWFRKKNS